VRAVWYALNDQAINIPPVCLSTELYFEPATRLMQTDTYPNAAMDAAAHHAERRTRAALAGCLRGAVGWPGAWCFGVLFS
jgi:hypothetical protein